MKYHIARNGQEIGIWTLAEIRTFLETGQLLPGDLAWREGMPGWISVADVLNSLQPPQLASDASTTAGAADDVATPPARPSTYLLPSVLVTLFCALLPGIPAIIHASRVNSRYDAGDYAGAAKASRAARFWCRIAFVFGLLVAGGIVASIVIPTIGKVRTTAARAVDGSNLRQIGQASLIYATEHSNKLPQAATIHDYARQLAADAGLDDASVWFAHGRAPAGVTTVLAPGDGPRASRAIDSAFRQSTPDVVVPLGGITAAMRSTTPVAWTRGLRADGTWAPDSPYQGEGGWIVFLGGQATWYNDLKSPSTRLVRFQDGTLTSDIREALPPGVRLSEK
ncbi:Interferon-induced transmembrane protein [Opitutaceae bacterium TAV1]|nr:Interferon-induced transmembrane protein [Opitutaceae bacterium TAV1]